MRNRVYKDDGALYITLPLFVICLTLFAAMFSAENIMHATKLRNFSTGVYYLHRPIYSILSIILLLGNIERNRIICFLCVTFFANMICVIAYKRDGFVLRLLK